MNQLVTVREGNISTGDILEEFVWHPIEEKILMHGDITEVAIVGIPDKKWGEIGIAICVPSAGASPSETDLIAFLKPKISSYKMPKEIHFWDSLPKSAYGKVTKKQVREVFLEKHPEKLK